MVEWLMLPNAVEYTVAEKKESLHHKLHCGEAAKYRSLWYNKRLGLQGLFHHIQPFGNAAEIERYGIIAAQDFKRLFHHIQPYGNAVKIGGYGIMSPQGQ